jgi:ZIP family zinc transporter
VDDLGAGIGWGALVGGSLLIGGLISARLRLSSPVAGTITAFGGGLMFSAVAFELVPDADGEAGMALTTFGLLTGCLIYVGANWLLERDVAMRRTRRMARAAAAGRPASGGGNQADVAAGEAIAVGMVVDGVPESIAFGLTITEGELGVALLAGIVVGNIAEAYGAAHPILSGGKTAAFVLRLLAIIGLVLALATVAGATVLADASSKLVGTTQAIAGGAVLAVLSTAVFPESYKEASERVALASVAGFVVGYLLS